MDLGYIGYVMEYTLTILIQGSIGNFDDYSLDANFYHQIYQLIVYLIMYQKYKIETIVSIAQSHQHYILIAESNCTKSKHIIHQTFQPQNNEGSHQNLLQIIQKYSHGDLYHSVLQQANYIFMKNMHFKDQIQMMIKILNIIKPTIQIYPYNLLFNQSLKYYHQHSLLTHLRTLQQIHTTVASINCHQSYQHIFNFAYTIYILLLSQSVSDYNYYLTNPQLLERIKQQKNIDQSLLMVLKSILLMRDGQLSVKIIHHSLSILLERQNCQLVKEIFQRKKVTHNNDRKMKTPFKQSQNYKEQKNNKLKPSASMINLTNSSLKKGRRLKKWHIQFSKTSMHHSFSSKNNTNTQLLSKKLKNSSYQHKYIINSHQQCANELQNISNVKYNSTFIKELLVNNNELLNQKQKLKQNGIEQSIKKFSNKIDSNVFNQLIIEKKYNNLKLHSHLYQINQRVITKDKKVTFIQNDVGQRQIKLDKQEPIKGEIIKNNQFHQNINKQNQQKKNTNIDILMENTNFIGKVMEYLNANLSKQKNYWYFLMYILYEKQFIFYQQISKYKKINQQAINKLQSSFIAMRKVIISKSQSYMSKKQIQQYLPIVKQELQFPKQKAISICINYFNKMSNILHKQKIRFLNQIGSLGFWLKHLHMIPFSVNIITNPANYKVNKQLLSNYELYINNCNLGMISIQSETNKMKSIFESKIE